MTITWWHNSNTDPGKAYYDKVAKDFEASHPGVTIQVSAMQHEDMLTKLDAAFQSGDAPDVYMERGGGELADHVEAGLTKDISESAKDAISTDRRLGGGLAGRRQDLRPAVLGRRRGLLVQQGPLREGRHHRARRPRWTSFNAAVDKLKAAGIAPVSVGAGDKWPAAHYWYYFALRECPKQVLQDAVKSLDFSDPCFVKAGEDLQKLVGTKPFNKGFLPPRPRPGATSASGLLATGKVAMEMQGHWEPGVMQGLTDDKKGLGDNTGWFPFPTVAGGQGDPSAALGGGDAWAVAKDAPDAAVELRQVPALRQGPEGLRGERHGPADQPGRGRLGQGPGPGRPAQGPRRGAVRAAVLRHRLRRSPSAAR